jgi:hypothetical protein
MASAGRQRRCADNGGQRKVTKRQAIVAQLVNRSATADFRAIKILLDTCGTSRARQTRHLPRPRLSEADEKVIEQIKVFRSPQIGRVEVRQGRLGFPLLHQDPPESIADCASPGEILNAR